MSADSNQPDDVIRDLPMDVAMDLVLAGKAEIAEITFSYIDKDGNVLQTVQGRAATEEERKHGS